MVNDNALSSSKSFGQNKEYDVFNPDISDQQNDLGKLIFKVQGRFRPLIYYTLRYIL